PVAAPPVEPNRAVELRGHQNPIQTVVYSPDGQQLATADGTFWKPEFRTALELVNAATGQTERAFGDHFSAGVQASAVSPDGKRLAASGFNEATVLIWEVATGKDLTLKGLERAVATLSFTPDGQRLVTGGGQQIFDPKKPPMPVPPGTKPVSPLGG